MAKQARRSVYGVYETRLPHSRTDPANVMYSFSASEYLQRRTSLLFPYNVPSVAAS
jgi:hypothetical protein